MNSVTLESHLLVKRVLADRPGSLVMEAFHQLYNCPVALKFTKHADDSAACEAALLLQARHHGVIEVIDIGRTLEGRTYFAMPLMRTNLDNFLHETGSISTATFRQLASSLAATIHHLHQLDIVHGDIKPSNVLVSCNKLGVPQFRLADFGQASVAGHCRRSGTAALGTAPYSAPEVLAGIRGGPKGDGFSFGTLLLSVLPAVILPSWTRVECQMALNPSIAQKPDQRPTPIETTISLLEALGSVS
jgi:eukaryotic-like serine/threonine-protein kinase